MESEEKPGVRYRSKVCAFGHFVWATGGRYPYLTSDWERDVYRVIVSEVEQLHGKVLAIGGMPNYIHLVVRLPGTVAPAQLMKQVKGVTSAMINRRRPEFSEIFRWQDSYAFFSIGQADEEQQAVIAYVRHQKEHHANSKLLPEWEETNEEFKGPSNPPARRQS